MTLKPSPKILLPLGVLGASFSSILVRFSQAPSLVTATYRLAWSVILLTVWVLLKCRADFRSVRRSDLFYCGLSGFFLALHFATWFESLKHTSITSSTVLVATEVIFTSLGFVFFLRGKLPPKAVLCIGITFAGSILIALADQGSAAANALWGDLLALAAALFVSAYTLIGRRQRGHLSTAVYTYLVYCACVLTLLCLDAFTGTPIVGYPPQELLIGLGLAVFCTLMGHSVFSYCLKFLSPAYVSSVKLCEPIGATLLGMAFFQEFPGPFQIAGGIVALCGVMRYSLLDKKQEMLKEDKIHAKPSGAQQRQGSHLE